MSIKVISVGDKLDLISVNNPSNGEEKRIYKSQVLDVYEGNRMQVAMPIEGHKVLLLPIGGKYEASFYAAGSIYMAVVQVSDRYKRRNQYVLDITLVSALKKYQRREYYRLEYAMDIFYRYMLPEEMEMEEDELKESMYREDLLFSKGITLDISGGGLRFVTDGKMHRGDGIIIKLLIEYGGEQKEIITPAKVIYSQNMLVQRDKIEHRIEFAQLENRHREQIIRFIFEKERSNRKKEKR